MTAYIKLSTMEFPRHDGDIAIDPVGPHDFEPVAWTDRPTFDPDTQDCRGGTPEHVDGQWHMTWVVVDLTPEEMAARDEARKLPKP